MQTVLRKITTRVTWTNLVIKKEPVRLDVHIEILIN